MAINIPAVYGIANPGVVIDPEYAPARDAGDCSHGKGLDGQVQCHHFLENYLERRQSSRYCLVD
jgi:hypothetical protein